MTIAELRPHGSAVLCGTVLNLALFQGPILDYVNIGTYVQTLLTHFDHVYRKTHTEGKVMWLAKPIYERLPQFYFLFGLLVVAGGLYLGFDFILPSTTSDSV